MALAVTSAVWLESGLCFLIAHSCPPDTLCNELDQERKARYAIQQKLKGVNPETKMNEWGGGRGAGGVLVVGYTVDGWVGGWMEMFVRKEARAHMDQKRTEN